MTAERHKGESSGDMRQDDQNKRYLIMDSNNMPLARCVLESNADAPNWQVRLLDDKALSLEEDDTVQLVSMTPGLPALLGRIVRKRNDRLVLEKLRSLGMDARQNLRMPTSFLSYIYPLTGPWIGRRKIRSKDLSCGGIAFYSEVYLDLGELVEVVIPITVEPLILKCQILRSGAADDGLTFYAAKFIDMCNEEETIVREAVFNVQLQQRSSATGDEVKGIGR